MVETECTFKTGPDETRFSIPQKIVNETCQQVDQLPEWHQGTLLLTWFNFSPSMDKLLYPS